MNKQDTERDVFISYASEERETVARPLAELLTSLGVSVWFDKFDLKMGDSLRRKIDEGLTTCRYGIVLLSPSFFGKHYTNRELDGLAQREVDGTKVILPVWIDIDEQEVRKFSPPLADRVAARWEDGIASIVMKIIEVIKPEVLDEFRNKEITLAIIDNGIGIAAEKLEKGPDHLPLFVGNSTKGEMAGEGIGTRQIYSTFGADNIAVESREGEFTKWTISLMKSTTSDTALLSDLNSKYVRLIKSTQKIELTEESSRTEISTFIWQLRQMEMFSFNLIYQFSRYNNIRDIFQSVLQYRVGGKSFNDLRDEVRKCRIDNPSIGAWVLGITRRISRNEIYIAQNVPFQEYKDVLFQSYGQSVGRTMIFTLDPESGNFFSTDRKLAEHIDFVPYLSRDKDELLRGELIGDVRNVNSPIYLGVWSVKNIDDLHRKLKLIQKGAGQLLQFGIEKEKRMAFYNTTYNNCDSEIDTLKTVTIGEMASLEEADLSRFIRPADNDMCGVMLVN